MAKIKKKRPTGKGNQPVVVRLRGRAASLLQRRGNQLRFIGGTAIDDTVVSGMETLVASEPLNSVREQLVVAIEGAVRNEKRRWTVTYAFFHEVDGEITVSSDYFYVEDARAIDMDTAANQYIAEQWSKQDKDSRIGQLWISTPFSVRDGEQDFLEELDEWLEEHRFFDAKYMRERLLINALNFDIRQSKLEEEARGLLEGVE